MRKLIRILAVGSCLLAPQLPALGEEMSTEAHVYPSGASVTFHVKVDRMREVLLPSAYDRDHFEVQAGEGTLRGFVVRPVKLPGWVPPSLEGQAKELRRLEAEIQDLSSAVAARAASLKGLDAASPKDPKRIPGWEAQRRELHRQMMGWSQRLSALKDKAQVLKDEMARLSPPGGDLLNRVTIDGTGSIKLSAWTDHASWRNRYSIRITGQRVQLDEELSISQRTGVDWNGIVTCHTASPRDFNQDQQLSPWVVDFRRPAEASPRSLMMKASDSLQASFEASQADVTFAAQGRVPGTGEEVVLRSGSMSLSGQVELTAMPLLSPVALLTVSTSPLPRTVLGGDANITLDGVPTGRAMLPPTPAGQSLRLTVGRASAVSASREERLTTRGIQGDRAFVKGTTVIRVSNGLERDVRVTLKDRVPVPADDSIRVSHRSSVPEDRAEDGILTWLLTVPAGGSREVTVEYTVTYPKGREVNLP
jgi:hypothetical protein